jgi:hypothetical protein
VLAIPIQIFGVLSLGVTARFVVLPLTMIAAVLLLQPSAQSAWALRGLGVGLLAVTAYDAVRLPMVAVGWWPDFIPRLGGWVLHTESTNLVAGYLWRYLGDGGGIGMAFYVMCGVLLSVRPQVVRRRPMTLAVGYGIFVWLGLVGTVVLPAAGEHMLFKLTPASLALSLLGHLIYGTVLGLGLRRVLAQRLPGAWPQTADRRPVRPGPMTQPPPPRSARRAGRMHPTGPRSAGLIGWGRAPALAARGSCSARSSCPLIPRGHRAHHRRALNPRVSRDKCLVSLG